ncbi:FAD-linked oxidase-like protein [Roridomyces roridus]|uniref:D-lactate dehydrogenase (cytochrome) n=1 Tax=Roridomyces roridus TaxID=1738132 RepID=A0AAD7B9D5_9AGAR|nr:FAD-linked oxidase-like protein [Roridomyces roridus]
MACLLRPQLFLRVAKRGPSAPVRGLRVRHYSTPPPSQPASAFRLSALAIGLGGVVLGCLVGSQLFPSSSSTPSKHSRPQYGSAQEFSQAIKDLRAVFSSREGIVSTDPSDVKGHGLSTNSYHIGVDHSVVVYPESTEDVVKIVKIANKYRMPIIPYSGATALEGHFIGTPGGGICVDMTSMNKILAINEADADVVVQPGLGWMELNETLESEGIPLFFPIDPAPTATIGGIASTGCSGTNAVRYGTAKAEWFLNLTVVLPNGEVIKTHRRSRKSSTGFDTTKLFIGSEGTLGIITEATLRLAPVIPTSVASVQFPNVQAAVQASIEILRSGIAAGIQCVELVDDNFLAATNKYGLSDHKYAVSDGLFFKFQAHSPRALADTARITKEICKRNGGTEFRLAGSDQEAQDIWADRKNAHFVGCAIRPGAGSLATDVCVPVSKLPELVLETKKDLERVGLPYTIVGHVGDGNFHAQILFDGDEELKEVKGIVRRMVHRAIALDGTCTGEHGVGIGKREFLVEELGEGTVALMKSIKRTLDPLGLMNPGKVSGKTALRQGN